MGFCGVGPRPECEHSHGAGGARSESARSVEIRSVQMGRRACAERKESIFGKGRENDGFLVVRPGTFWTSFGAIFHQKSMKKSMRKSMPKKS